MSSIVVSSEAVRFSRLFLGGVSLFVAFAILCSVELGGAVSRSTDIQADPVVSSEFVTWWLHGALDYSSSQAAFAHESASKWVDEPVAGSFERTFWSDGKGLSEQIVFVPDYFWSPVYVDCRTVGLQVSGNLISLADPAMQSRYVRLDFKVRRDSKGLRISGWELVYEANRRDLTEFLSRKPTGQADIELNRKALNYFISASRLDRKQDMMGALRDYSMSIRLNPKFALAYLDRGRVCHALKVDSIAIQDFSKAIEMGPELWQAYFNRALVRSNLGDTDGSTSDYSDVIRLIPGCPYAYANRAIERDRRGDQKGALTDLNEAVSLSRSEDKATSLHQRAYCLYWSDSLLPALFDCNEAIRLDPGFASTYRLRSDIRRKLFDQSGAHQDLRTAQRLDEGIPPGR